MFINSIFLPKNLSDQTLPEGVVNTIGNFSHLFSNVFKIVKDGQESLNPIQLLTSTNILSENIQDELLKVSFISDNRIAQDNSNISNIVSLFMSQIRPGEDVQELADSNKIKISEKAPKYFSLSKNDFAKEIKNIIESLRNGDSGQLENVEISLITGGVSISINPKVISIAEIESLITEQLQTNDDFKILVQSGNQKLTLDVEPIKNETTKTENPTEIISIVTDDKGNSENTNFEAKSSFGQSLIIKNNDLSQDELQQPLKGLKPIIEFNTKYSPILENIITKMGTNKAVSVDLKTDIEIELLPDNSGEIVSEVKPNLEKGETNISNYGPNNNVLLKSGIGKEFIPKIQNEVIPELKVAPQKYNVVENSNIPAAKSIKSEYLVNPEIKSSNVKSQVKTNNFKISSDTKTPVNIKPGSKLNENEIIQSSKTINVKSNQKIHSVSINKTTIADKNVLNDLMEKTNVKEIDVKAQKFEKLNVVNIPKNFSGDNSKSIEIKTDATINKISLENKDLIFVNTSTQTKQSTNKISFEPVTVRPDKTTNISNVEKQVTSNPELSTKVAENAKVKIVPDYKPQQELFSENEIVENESKYLSKSESIKSSVTPQNLVDFKSNPHKPINKIEFAVKESIDLQNLKVVESKKVFVAEVKTAETESLMSQILKNVSDYKQNPVDVRSNTQVVNTENETEANHFTSTNKDSTDVVVKASDKETVKESLSVKDNFKAVVGKSEKKDFASNINAEKTIKNIKEPIEVDNSNKEFVELSENETKDETVVKNQSETKNVKIDFKERRIYSQVPKLEVIADDKTIEDMGNGKKSSEPITKEKAQLIDEPVKSIVNQPDAKPKVDKQVWVKVSVEKNDVDVTSEVKRTTQPVNKITINANSDGVKKDFTSNNNSEKESHENPKQKPQNVSVEAVQSSEQKPVVQNANQNETTVNVKQEIKTEQNTFKSELNNHETKLTSRQAEMVERIKVISSGEMVREVYKVLENGEKQSVVLKLVPKELGAIKVVLDTIDNVLSAKVEVENESVGTVIRNNVEQLKQNLAQSGVHVNSINISYHNSDQKQHGFNNQKRKNPAYTENSELEEVDETIVTKKMGYNTYEFLA